MAAKGFSASRIAELLQASKSAEEYRTSPVGLFIAVDRSASRELICGVRDACLPTRAETTVTVQDITSSQFDIPAHCDAALLIVGTDGGAATRMTRTLTQQGIPCALIAESILDIPDDDMGGNAEGAAVTPVVASDGATLQRRLAQWLLDAVDNPLAIAASFPFCRAQLASRLRMRCAAENAAIGAVDVIHGSDFPLMVANQLKLSFSLAAAYGESPSARYALDAALVCACGIGWRAFVRRVSDVIPFGSWMVRATFGFAGTMATGLLLEARHDGTLKKTIEKSHIGLRRVFSVDDAGHGLYYG